MCYVVTALRHNVDKSRGQNAALAETHTDNGKSRGNKLTKDDLAKLSDRPGRHGDGGGLYFRAIGERRAYFVYRYRIAGKEREISIGPYPEVSLAEARIKHAALRKTVVSDKRDPVAEKRAAKVSAISAAAKPTFGECADRHIAAHAASWRNPKSEEQWRMTLTTYCAPIRDMPIDKVDTEAVLACLKPVWTRAPETASRLRGRIEAVLASARVDGWDPPGPDEPGAVARLARPQTGESEEDRRGHAVCRSASVHGAARRHAGKRGQSARLHRTDRRAIRRSARHDVGRSRSRHGDMDHPGFEE